MQSNRWESLAASMPHASLRPRRHSGKKQLKNKPPGGVERQRRLPSPTNRLHLPLGPAAGRGRPQVPQVSPSSVVVNFFWTLVSLPSRFISAHFCFTSNNPARHISADEHIVLRQSRVAGMRTKTICGALYFFFFSGYAPPPPARAQHRVTSILT